LRNIPSRHQQNRKEVEAVEAAEEPFYLESKTKESFRATQLND
jgi:hypothetical protein